MAQYIAFLRAINVGGHVVKMDVLRKFFEDLKLAEVDTFIASGNVIFRTAAKDVAALESKIERHLEKSLGYPVATMVRTPAELAEVLAYAETLEVAETDTLHVSFLRTAPDGDVNRRLETVRTDVDDLHVRGRELYWRCTVKFNESKVKPNALAKALGVDSTARNVKTVRKLVAKFPAQSK